MPGIRFNHSGQLLSENSPLANRRLAVELAHVEDHLHRNTTPGQVGERSRVAAVDTSRWLLAKRTPGWYLSGGKDDGNSVTMRDQIFKFKIDGRQKKNTVERSRDLADEDK